MLWNANNEVLARISGAGRRSRGRGALALATCIAAAGCAAASDSSPSTQEPIEHEQKTTMTKTTMTKATMIPMTAASGQQADLRSFLTVGRDLVAKTEPGTPYWYALEQEGGAGGFAIFDLFPNQAGRDAHFNGEVAAALAGKAPQLVDGGWDDGVVANVQHYQTIGQKLPDEPVAVTKATFISLQAAPGQADALAQFLVAGCQMVIDGEPLTPYWLALRSEVDDHRFAIVDLFAGPQGREAHFKGDVAAALEANADTLVAGGWTQGVLANVVHFDVVAAR